jgi:hypothetical protein
MIDRKEQTAAHLACERHHAVVGRDDHRADRGRDVDPAVTRTVGIVGRIEGTNDRAGDRPRPRNGGPSSGGWTPHGRDYQQDGTETSHRRDATGEVRTGS